MHQHAGSQLSFSLSGSVSEEIVSEPSNKNQAEGFLLIIEPSGQPEDDRCC